MYKHVFAIAEIGINHNGDMTIAKRLIDEAHAAGFDAVKFQKRDVDSVYSPEELSSLRDSPWGTTYRQQKEGLEFSESDFNEIDSYCKKIGIEWFISAWDIPSLEFARKYNLKYNKVASPMLTVLPLVEEIAREGKYTFISTGMSTMEEIETAVGIFNQYGCPFELMHCNSSYPSRNDEANLLTMKTLKNKFQCDIGYSGHEKGYQVSLAAVALGATSLERHITIDRSMYGSDQAASLGISGFQKMIRDVRVITSAMGDGIKRVYDSEMPSRNKLATPHWYKMHLEKNND
jgi:N-acetylneuraminate synthase